MSLSLSAAMSVVTAFTMFAAWFCSLLALQRATRACAMAEQAARISHDAKSQASYAEGLAECAFGTTKPEATR